MIGAWTQDRRLSLTNKIKQKNISEKNKLLPHWTVLNNQKTRVIFPAGLCLNKNVQKYLFELFLKLLYSSYVVKTKCCILKIFFLSSQHQFGISLNQLVSVFLTYFRKYERKCPIKTAKIFFPLLFFFTDLRKLLAVILTKIGSWALEDKQSFMILQRASKSELKFDWDYILNLKKPLVANIVKNEALFQKRGERWQLLKIISF